MYRDGCAEKTGVLRDGHTEMDVQRDRMYKETGCREAGEQSRCKGPRRPNNCRVSKLVARSADSATPTPRQARTD